ncbi:response regulator [Halalkalibacter alkalisediminis]|uniref:response regulator transcription factor n=1 Tax=Halalkalibacter alkalisediminis TaxID=935616 RepID=UPI0036382AC2
MEKLNCEWVGEAHNGREGIEMIKETNPDIIITDIYMPMMNGLEMIEELKTDNFERKVIILSGFNDFEYARQAMKLKIADYLSKPASIDTITEVLENVIKQLEEENAEKFQVVELRNKVNVYEPLIEKEWIKSVVTGTSDLVKVPTCIQPVIESWKDKEHIILAIAYDEALQHTSLYHSDWNLFRFACSNIINEITVSVFKDFQYIEIHIFQGALWIQFEQEQLDFRARLEELSHKIEIAMQTYLHVKASVSIGTLKKSWKEISASMKDALYQPSKQMENEEMFQGKSVTNTKEIWSKSIEASQKLSEAIRYADEKTACEIILTFFNILEDHPYTKTAAVRIGIEMWTVMTYSLHDIGIRTEDILPENTDLPSELSLCKNWDDVKQFLLVKIKQICQQQYWDENIKHRQLVEQMIDYVQKNLSENITLQDIANELYISRNYLGQIFKNIVGEPFKNYITRARMEMAKKMIQEGNYLIYEVSEKVGYVNPAYFTTTFKKYTGYTPTDLIHKKTISQ